MLLPSLLFTLLALECSAAPTTTRAAKRDAPVVRIPLVRRADREIVKRDGSIDWDRATVSYRVGSDLTMQAHAQRTVDKYRPKSIVREVQSESIYGYPSLFDERDVAFERRAFFDALNSTILEVAAEADAFFETASEDDDGEDNDEDPEIEQGQQLNFKVRSSPVPSNSKDRANLAQGNRATPTPTATATAVMVLPTLGASSSAAAAAQISIPVISVASPAKATAAAAGSASQSLSPYNGGSRESPRSASLTLQFGLAQSPSAHLLRPSSWTLTQDQPISGSRARPALNQPA